MKKADKEQVVENEDVVTDEVINEEIDNMSESGEGFTDTMSEESEDQAAIWQDKYARLSAEFDNFRKRTVKEKMELISNGGEKVLRSVIDVVDDFERALGALDKQSSEYIGLELIYKKLMDTLKSQGVKEIEAKNSVLDVDFHEAIAKFPTGDPANVGIVIDVVQKGYMLNDKVLRFAKVVVGE